MVAASFLSQAARWPPKPNFLGGDLREAGGHAASPPRKYIPVYNEENDDSPLEN